MKRNCTVITTATVAVISALAAVPVQGALVTYTDRTTWLSAVGTLSGTENFNSFSTDKSFVTGTVSANNMTLSGTEGRNTTSTQKIDASPFDSSFASFTPNGTSYMLNDIWDDDCVTNPVGCSAGPNYSRIDFNNAVSAWGADFVGISNRVTESRIEIFAANNSPLGTITATTIADASGDFAQRFFGFALTEGDVADHIVFRTGGTGANDVFGVDDIGFAFTTAPVGTDTVFNFSGVCTDCQGTVTGLLTLTNFISGQALSLDNFVSFHYDGSDLLDEFTVNRSDLETLWGTLLLDGTITSTSFGFGLFDTDGCLGCYVQVNADGHWWIEEDDYGTQGQFSTAPEPATLALLGLGIAGIGYQRRKRAA